MVRIVRLVGVGVLLAACLTACVGPSRVLPPPVRTSPAPPIEQADGKTVLLLGGSYVRSAAPALVAAFATAGVTVYDASENGVNIGHFDSLLFDWRADFGAYIDELEPDMVVASLPIGLEVLDFCRKLPGEERGECIAERTSTKAATDAHDLAAFMSDRGVPLLLYGDVALWPGSGRVDGVPTQWDIDIYTAMRLEEVMLAETMSAYGHQFVSVRDALTGPFALFWTQEADGQWYNWRFPEAANVHWCARGAAQLAVLLAPFVASDMDVSMRDEWVRGQWVHDSWYQNAGCSNMPSPYPRYAPATYDAAAITHLPSAGRPDIVQSVRVPPDQAICAMLGEDAIAAAMVTGSLWRDPHWSVSGTSQPKWYLLPPVSVERMQWVGGCRFELQFMDDYRDEQWAVTLVEWAGPQSAIADALVTTGHVLQSTTTDSVLLYTAPPSMVRVEVVDDAHVPTVALTSVSGRTFTVHADPWPAVAAVEDVLRQSSAGELPLPASEVARYQSWLKTGAAPVVAAALHDLATQLMGAP